MAYVAKRKGANDAKRQRYSPKSAVQMAIAIKEGGLGESGLQRPPARLYRQGQSQQYAQRQHQAHAGQILRCERRVNYEANNYEGLQRGRRSPLLWKR